MKYPKQLYLQPHKSTQKLNQKVGRKGRSCDFIALIMIKFNCSKQEILWYRTRVDKKVTKFYE